FVCIFIEGKLDEGACFVTVCTSRRECTPEQSVHPVFRCSPDGLQEGCLLRNCRREGGICGYSYLKRRIVPAQMMCRSFGLHCCLHLPPLDSGGKEEYRPDRQGCSYCTEPA